MPFYCNIQFKVEIYSFRSVSNISLYSYLSSLPYQHVSTHHPYGVFRKLGRYATNRLVLGSGSIVEKL